MSSVLEHLQRSDNSRHYCRNRHCRAKLKTPTDNLHRAFCVRGCYQQFYRNRCVVCEKELPPGRSDRRFCRKPSCRNQYRRNPVLFDFGEPKTGHSTGPADLALKSPIKSGAFCGLEPDRPWRIAAGPKISASNYHCATVPLDPERAKRTAAANDQDRIRSEIAWNERRPHSPVDVTTHSRWQPSWQPQWPSPTDDLPKFLKREPGS